MSYKISGAVRKMIKIKKVKKGSIKPTSSFKSLEEEAHFWDTHSVVDEINQGTVVGFHKPNKIHTITIRFQPEHLKVLREKAFGLGIGPTTLARMWILEHLKGQERSTLPTP